MKTRSFTPFSDNIKEKNRRNFVLSHFIFIFVDYMMKGINALTSPFTIIQ